MLDINFIRQNKEKVRRSTKEKGLNPDLVDNVLRFDEERRKLIGEVEKLREERNELTKKFKDSHSAASDAASRDKQISNKHENLKQKVREIKKKLEDIEPQLKKVEINLNDLLMKIPNPPAADVKVGKGEAENEIIRQWGKVAKLDFKPKDHLEIAENLDIIDFKRGVKVAGNNFYYLKNDGALLEMALVRYGLDFLVQKGFIPIITPDLARQKYYLGTGYTPKGPEAQTYTINDSDLGLVATAEVTLAGYHADETLEEKDLPLKYAGYSHCFRLEAGAYGKYSKGLYRVHQFTKVEMFSFVKPEQSEKMHEELLKIEEEFWQSLGIPYRVVKMCTGDLGAQAVKKYDLEAWMPGRGDWGEITSTSNTTDYQARRLNIKFKNKDKRDFVHTLNGTLVATSRGIISILENFQQKDGSVKIPKALENYMGKKEIKRN